VVIVESHGTAGDDPGMFAEMNLRMLVLSGGRERTIEDYQTLAASGRTDNDRCHNDLVRPRRH
jgi:hypothetical protein